jgi:hypothetical protein
VIIDSLLLGMTLISGKWPNRSVAIHDAIVTKPGTPIARPKNKRPAMMQNSAQPTPEPVAKLDEVGHDRAMPSMSIAMWVAIGAGLFGLAMTLLLFKRSAGRMDLGSVSEQWMAQHRAGRVDDPQH